MLHKPKGILKKPSLGTRLKASRCEWCGKETSAVVMHQVRMLKELGAQPTQKTTRVGYYRGGKRGKEIDIVVDYPNIDSILIEVKYREEAPFLMMT